MEGYIYNASNHWNLAFERGDNPKVKLKQHPVREQT